MKMIKFGKVLWGRVSGLRKSPEEKVHDFVEVYLPLKPQPIQT